MIPAFRSLFGFRFFTNPLSEGPVEKAGALEAAMHKMTRRMQPREMIAASRYAFSLYTFVSLKIRNIPTRTYDGRC
jgi:hypothetical protein